MSRRSSPSGRRRDQPSSRAARAAGAGGRGSARTPRSDPRLVAGVVIVGLALLAGVFALGTLGGGAPVPTPGPGQSSVAGACPTSQPPALASGDTRTVTIQTAMGTIVIKVDGSLSPIATGNFVALASCGFYDGLVFHRVVPNFVIQGGDPNGNGSGGPGYTIADDPITGTYHRGTVAMARTTQPHSQGSQFFIVLSDSAASSLASASPGYAILGEVTSGMDAVDAIAAAADGENPSNPIAMDSVTVATP
ncbi:MAG TPA: peptidylprolyl isomerase [Candidatus Limnocylindrales bacterium]|nr:peptidylprolyl isomerase [Candidatus Limnocylindrales bacterium]